MPARRDCIYCRKYYKRHLPKCPSKNHDPLVQNNFYASEASEEENGEINFQMILNEVHETNSNTIFFWRMFEEESRNNKNDKAVSITALAVSAIAPTIDRLARMSKTMV